MKRECFRFGIHQGILLLTTNKFSLDDGNFDDVDSEIIIHIRLMACKQRKQRKACKKRDKQRINACSMASNKMVGLVHVRG